MKELKALFVTFVLIAMPMMAMLGSAPHVKAAQITYFEGGNSYVDLSTSDLGGLMVSQNIVLPGNARVVSAFINISGLPYTPGGTDYPEDITLDVGYDKIIEWGWSGTLGVQRFFSDGNDTYTHNFNGAGSVTSKKLRLPANATVTNATLEVAGGNIQYFNEKPFFGHSWDFMGLSVAAAGDVNGDGVPDFVGGGPHAGWGMWNNGRVAIIFGGKTMSDTPDVEIVAPLDDERFGWSVDGAGDVNGDGYDDIIVGADNWGTSTEWNRGAAYIYYGGPTMDATPDVTLRGTMEYDYLGYSVAGIGDVNLDGFDDVLVGAPGNDTDLAHSDTGAAYLLYGGDPMNNVPDHVFYGLADDYELGTLVANVSDINNDGYTDFMITAPWDGDGSVSIYYGGTVLNTTVDVNIKPLANAYSFGVWASGVGDLNGDGYDDIGVMNDYNEVWVYHGGNPMDSQRDLYFTGEGPFDYYGYAISSAGDLNLDGCDELLVGAFSWNNSVYETGKAYMYWGGQSMDDKADYVWRGKNQTDEFGMSVAGVGDVNLDGIPDFVIGDDGNDTWGVNAGTLHLMLFASGLKDPKIALQGGATLWNRSGFFKGVQETSDFSSQLNTALRAATPQFSDSYSNMFSDLPLDISSKSKGDIQIRNISLEYTLNVTPKDFASELNNYIASNPPGMDGNYRIPLRVRTHSPGTVRLSGLNVQLNTLPNGTAPSGLTHPEGTKNQTFLDLYTVFSDTEDQDTDLVFNITDISQPLYVKASLYQGHFLSIDTLTGSADVNWTGKVIVNITAKDLGGALSKVVSIPIVVTNVEDAPIITSRPILSANENVQWTYDVVVVDGDPGDVLAYSYWSDAQQISYLNNPPNNRIEMIPNFMDAPEVHISVNVSDGTVITTQAFTVKVELRTMAGNHLPVITSTPDLEGKAGYTYQYQIRAVDEDGDKLAYSVVDGPQGMAVDSNGIVTWTPVANDAGKDFPMMVNVSDGFDRVFQKWVVNVSETGLNHLPSIIGEPPAKAYIGVQYYYKFTATDEDSDLVTFRLYSGPAGMTVNGDGAVTWTPAATQNGPQSFTIEATDGKGLVRKACTTEVVLNHVPSIKSFPVLDAKVGKSYKYVLTIEDLDPLDQVNVTLVQAPSGMTYDPVTKTLTWKPTKKQSGVNTVNIVVSDGIQQSNQEFTIKVKGQAAPSIFEQMGLLLLLILVVVIVTIIGVFAYLRMKKKKAEAQTIIEDVFLTYRDGRLISHHTRRLKPEQDEHTMTAMLTAIQSFVQDSVPTEGEAQKPIEEISFGKDRILMQHGTYVYIAAVIKGTETETLKARMSDAIRKIETEFQGVLTEWDGDLRDLDGAKRITNEILHGHSDEKMAAQPESVPPSQPPTPPQSEMRNPPSMAIPPEAKYPEK